MLKLFLPLFLLTGTLAASMSAQWSTDPDNLRPYMIQHASLVQAAQWKAHILNTEFNGVIQHCVNGECPNKTIEKFGCNSGYNQDGNSVESLVSGTVDITVAYNALKNSPGHRPHILGEGYHNEQIHYGVGQEGVIYVFISAKCS